MNGKAYRHDCDIGAEVETNCDSNFRTTGIGSHIDASAQSNARHRRGGKAKRRIGATMAVAFRRFAFPPVTSHTHGREANAETTSSSDRRWLSEVPDFFAGMFASLRRAELDRFFGVTPPVAKSRTKGHSGPEQTGDGDNAETRQAKNIYQAMLDITGH